MHDYEDCLAIERRLIDKAIERRALITGHFELTPLCNFSCDMCFIHMSKHQVEKQGGLLPLVQWLNFACQLKEMGVLFLLLSGGEPLLFPRFPELYAQLKKMGFILTINTNGTLITEDVAELFARLVPRRVNITLYGGSNETYLRLCGAPHGFDQCVEAVKRLRDRHIDVKLNCTLTRKNQDDFPAIMAFADEMQLPVTFNSYLSPYLRKACQGCRLLLPERMSVEDTARTALEYKQHELGERFSLFAQLQLQTQEQPPADKGVDLECHAGKSSGWITWQGHLTPCVGMEDPWYDVCHMPIAEAWKKLVNDCEEIERHEECVGCHLRGICQACYSALRDEKLVCGGVDYLCQVAKEKERLLRSCL